MKKGGDFALASHKARIEDPVANDKNWRTNVTSELRAAERWPAEWGFLVS